MLVVEDEPDIQYILQAHFKKDGYDVLTAGSAEAGLKLARKYDPAIVLLDITLPKMSGLDMLRELRLFSKAPVLFLTAKKDEIDRIVGLKLGADDYITKPFSLEELRLRVKRILHHTSPSSGGMERQVRVGGVEIDFERHTVRVNGRPVALTPREFQLMKLLIEADGKVLSREQLSQGIWGEDKEPGHRHPDGGPDHHPPAQEAVAGAQADRDGEPAGYQSQDERGGPGALQEASRMSMKLLPGIENGHAHSANGDQDLPHDGDPVDPDLGVPEGRPGGAPARGPRRPLGQGRGGDQRPP